MFNITKISQSFKKDDNGLFLETSTGIKMPQRETARKMGYEVKTGGTPDVPSYSATGKFYIDLDEELSLETLIEYLAMTGSKNPEEDIVKAWLSDYVLAQHGKNRATMNSKLNDKLPKDCETILAFIARLGIDTSELTFEQKADKAFLESFVSSKLG